MERSVFFVLSASEQLLTHIRIDVENPRQYGYRCRFVFGQDASSTQVGA